VHRVGDLRHSSLRLCRRLLGRQGLGRQGLRRQGLRRQGLQRLQRSLLLRRSLDWQLRAPGNGTSTILPRLLALRPLHSGLSSAPLWLHGRLLLRRLLRRPLGRQG